MKRGRKPLAERPVKWTVQIPETIAANVELHLPVDPLTNLPVYGKKSSLVAALLELWVKEKAKGNDPVLY